jgi:hypothetical protein
MPPSRYSGMHYPIDLALLERVFDQVSKARGLARGSPEAQALAAELVRLNQQGLVEEEDLLRALSIGDRWRH